MENILPTIKTKIVYYRFHIQDIPFSFKLTRIALLQPIIDLK